MRTKNKVKNTNEKKIERNVNKKGGEKNMSKDTRKPGEKVVTGRVKAAREQAVITAAVGEVLSAMQKANVSKSELARALGVSAPNVHQTLDPSRAMTLRSLARIADALGRTVQIRLVVPKAA